MAKEPEKPTTTMQPCQLSSSDQVTGHLTSALTKTALGVYQPLSHGPGDARDVTEHTVAALNKSGTGHAELRFSTVGGMQK